ncbi:MAG: lipoprotein signal peptidase [Bacteroidales bacterium]|nr:lipoprotein signal peptidase [Bacteroidales bacterium]
MSKTRIQLGLTFGIVLGVLVVDQLIKIAVKTTMYLHEHIRITDWFYILFTENNGMAFGWQFFDKIFLTLFRLIAVFVIGLFVSKSIKRGAKTGFIVCLAMIIAGAAGNIIDCLFYGQIFSESTSSQIAEFVPFGSGYQPLFYGRVVDMFYFPLFEFDWPSWMPVVANDHFIFFSPIFNFADASISVGVVLLLLFYRDSLNAHFNAD